MTKIGPVVAISVGDGDGRDEEVCVIEIETVGDEEKLSKGLRVSEKKIESLIMVSLINAVRSENNCVVMKLPLENTELSKELKSSLALTNGERSRFSLMEVEGLKVSVNNKDKVLSSKNDEISIKEGEVLELSLEEIMKELEGVGLRPSMEESRTNKVSIVVSIANSEKPEEKSNDDEIKSSLLN